MPTTDTFLIRYRKLTEAEEMHIKAVKAAAENLFTIIRGNTPDPYCMAESIKKLEECVMWSIKSITVGHHIV